MPTAPNMNGVTRGYAGPASAYSGGAGYKRENTLEGQAELADARAYATKLASGYSGTQPRLTLSGQPPAPTKDQLQSAYDAFHPAAAPEAQFMTPSMQRYVDQFKASQGRQQEAINSGLLQAMQGLGARRDAAAKVAAQVPGEYDKAYAQANADQRQFAKDAGFAGQKTIGGGLEDKAMAAANAQSKASGHANQPILEAGITADYSKGATTLNNTHMQNQAAISEQQQAFDLQMLNAQAQWDSQQQQYKQANSDAAARQAAGFKHDEEMAVLNSSLSDRHYQTPESQAYTQKAFAAGFNSPEEYKAASNNPLFYRFANAIKGNNAATFDSTAFGGNDGKEEITDSKGKVHADVLRKLLAALPNDVIKALQYEGLIPGQAQPQQQ